MSDNKIVSMSIDPELVKNIVKQQIEQAIVRELGDAEEYMKSLISVALNHKVDSSGKFTDSSWEKRTFLQYLFEKTLTDSAKSAFVEYMDKNSKEFKKQFKEFFKSKDVKKRVNEALERFCIRQLDNINSNISISFDRRYE